MNNLEPQYLHLLLDEPIYALDEHFEGHDMQIENENIVPDNKPSIFKGGNKKGILILNDANYPDIISSDDEKLLFKGLNALNILIEDIAVLSSDRYRELEDEIEHTRCIHFGVHASEEKLYHVEANNGNASLKCHPISEIRSNQELKVKLWRGLQSLFIG